MRPPVVAAFAAVAFISTLVYYANSSRLAGDVDLPQQKHIAKRSSLTSNPVGSVLPVAAPVQTPTAGKVQPGTVKITGKTSNSFVYHPDKPASFTCTQGTRISFSNDAFEDAETGEAITGPVSVVVKEFYKLDDIVMNGLHTLSTGGLLETNGMIHVEANAGGRLCKLKEGEEMKLLFPNVNDKPGMELFTGEKTTDNAIIWKPLVYRPKILDVSDTTDGKEGAKVDKLPSYPSGIAGINRYINSRIIVPEGFSQHWQGVMEVEFCITPFNGIENIKVIKELNEEATRQVAVALSEMRFWKRGMRNGRPARYKAAMKVVFRKWHKEVYITGLSKPFEYAPYTETDRDFGAEINNYYSFSVTKLGWINCDRFINLPQRTQLYIRNGSKTNNEDVKLIFHNYKSILNSAYRDSGFVFANIPAGEPVTIIAIRSTPDGLYMAMENTNTSVGAVDIAAYTKVTAAQVRASLKQFDTMFNTTSMRQENNERTAGVYAFGGRF